MTAKVRDALSGERGRNPMSEREKEKEALYERPFIP